MTINEKKLRNAYRGQQLNAEGRGIGFSLSFTEWLQIWIESGHLVDRGPGKYVMARLGDKGPYAVGNVKIITHKENIQEAFVNKSPEELNAWKEGMKRGGRANRGRSRPDLADRNRSQRGQPRNRESVEKTRLKQIGQKRTVETRAKISTAIKAARKRKRWGHTPNAEERAKRSATMKRTLALKKERLLCQNEDCCGATDQI